MLTPFRMVQQKMHRLGQLHPSSQLMRLMGCFLLAGRSELVNYVKIIMSYPLEETKYLNIYNPILETY